MVDALKAGLGRVKKFIWCGDADGAGRILRDDMVRILGAARFYFVEWPEGVKDANDMLLSDGMEPLGIYQLSGLPETAPIPSGPLNEPGGRVGDRNPEYRDADERRIGGRDLATFWSCRRWRQRIVAIS